ncbi:MAG: thioredoxin [Ruminococcaceae bacterium]|nr:thioredoxin [Oscillospiraceae bacterium]
MSELKITKDNFENEVLNSDKPVMLDFYADWCGPCKMIAPFLHEISEERADIKVGKINVDEEGELADTFCINSIPAVFVVKNGEVTNQAIGYRSKDELLKLLY